MGRERAELCDNQVFPLNVTRFFFTFSYFFLLSFFFCSRLPFFLILFEFVFHFQTLAVT